MSKKRKQEPDFRIREELKPILRGLETTNWSTIISKNNVKTVTVTFRPFCETLPVVVK